MAAATSVAFLSARGLRLLLLVERGLLTWPRATLVAAAAQAAALFVPARVGELALPLLLSRATGRSFSSGVGTLLAARTLDLATLGIWSGVSVLAVWGFHSPLAIAVSIALLAPSVLLPLTLSAADRLGLKCLGPRGVRGRRWARRVRRVRLELDGLLRRPFRLIAAAVVSFVMWGLQWTVAWFLLAAMGYRWSPTMVVACSATAAVANPRGRVDRRPHGTRRATPGGRRHRRRRPSLGPHLRRDLRSARLGGVDGVVREEINRTNRRSHRSRRSFQRAFFRNPK